jgi:hypothetical protein
MVNLHNDDNKMSIRMKFVMFQGHFHLHGADQGVLLSSRQHQQNQLWVRTKFYIAKTCQKVPMCR